MALSIYTATGVLNAGQVSQSLPKPPVARYVSGGAFAYDETNLRNRYTLMKRYTMTVQVQDVPSQGHRVDFYDQRGSLVATGVSGADGKVTGIFGSDEPVTAVIKDKPGGDDYNSMIRAGLIPVPFDVR